MTATQDILQICHPTTWQTLGCKVVKLFVDHYNKMLRQQLAMEPSHYFHRPFLLSDFWAKPRKHEKNPISTDKLHLKIVVALCLSVHHGMCCKSSNTVSSKSLVPQVGGVHLDNEERVRESLSSCPLFLLNESTWQAFSSYLLSGVVMNATYWARIPQGCNLNELQASLWWPVTADQGPRLKCSSEPATAHPAHRPPRANQQRSVKQRRR